MRDLFKRALGPCAYAVAISTQEIPSEMIHDASGKLLLRLTG